jgi:hypothetical protein
MLIKAMAHCQSSIAIIILFFVSKYAVKQLPGIPIGLGDFNLFGSGRRIHDNVVNVRFEAFV